MSAVKKVSHPTDYPTLFATRLGERASGFRDPCYVYFVTLVLHIERLQQCYNVRLFSSNVNWIVSPHVPPPPHKRDVFPIGVKQICINQRKVNLCFTKYLFKTGENWLEVAGLVTSGIYTVSDRDEQIDHMVTSQ